MTRERVDHPFGEALHLRDFGPDANHEALVFFGNRHATRENLERDFPRFRFIALKQTHSDILVASPYEGDAPEADAHWTRESGVALCIRTADCVPVILIDPTAPAALAIHAGWRGVENQIVRKSCDTLREQNFDFQNAWAFIGPHIGLESFEVDRDVAERLDTVYRMNQRSPNLQSAIHPHPNPVKARVDLSAVVREQLQAAGVAIEHIHECHVDTVTSVTHESFRRDRERSGRQISFVAISTRTSKSIRL